MTAIAPASPPQASPAKPMYTVRDLLMDKQQEILAALPRHITPAYFMRVVLTAVQRTPKLAQCDPLSFLGAVLQCAQLGLVPDGFLGQAYLIPYENKRRKHPRTGEWGVLEAQFQAGYRGLITLTRRSGEVTTIHAEVVHQKDTFRQTFGLNPSIEHVKHEGDEDPGAITHVYAFYRMKDGSYDLVVMNKREIDKIRARSQAYLAGQRDQKKRDSPWYTDEAAMWKKTAIKQLLKMAPLSIEIQRVAGLDDAHEAGLPQDLRLLADPSAEATALPEGDIDETGGDDTIEMPQRQSAQPQAATPGGEPLASPPAGAPSGAGVVTSAGGTGGGVAPVTSAAVSPPPSTIPPGASLVVDQITVAQKRPSTKPQATAGFWWGASTKSGINVHTYNPAIGGKVEHFHANDGLVDLLLGPAAGANGLREVLSIQRHEGNG